jgi:hypothetical protein
MPEALGAGIVALPLGAFVFGVTISVVQLLAQAVFGGHYRTLSDGCEPIQSKSSCWRTRK